MSSRSRMVHRCTLQRDVNAGSVDNWGPVAPSYQDRRTQLPCYIWQPTYKTYALGEIQGRVNATFIGWEALIPKDTDVTDKDVLTDVTTRAGVAVTDDTFNILQVQRTPTHLHLVLESIQNQAESEVAP